MNNISESIVLIGGGGGVYRIARSLKHLRSNITTIQTMFDKGNHSGKLRDERGVLPPGDIRQAILALSDDDIEDSLRLLLSFRFAPQNGSSIDDVSLGNLMLAALTESYGDPMRAINAMCRIFRVKGMVLPVSLDHADLYAVLSDGSTLHGEDKIDTRLLDDERTIVSVGLRPEASIFTGAYEAIIKADKIVFCPGDLFTSIIPNALVSGFGDAISDSRARIIFVTNIMTKKSETHGFTASKFAETLLSYLGRERFHDIICNNAPIKQEILDRYKLEQAEPVMVDEDRLVRFTRRIHAGHFADQSSKIVRHNQSVSQLISKL